MSRRGALLIEAMVAVAVFTVAGLAILAAMRSAAREAQRERDLLRAIDLARSAMSRMEAGLATPDQLNGPVPVWRDETAGGFDDAPPAPSGWSMQVETDTSPFSGLAQLTVRVRRARTAGSDAAEIFALRQLVRLSDAGAAP